MRHKITPFLAIAVAALLAGFVPRAFAQTYEKTHTTGIVLAGGGNDLLNTLTLQLAGNTAGGLTWNVNPVNANGVFINDGSGGLSWGTTLPTGLTLNNETIGGSTTINTTGGITGGTITSNGNTNIDAGTNTGGTVNIGNSTSTTNLDGTVNITGSVTYTTTPSIPLATNDIFTGQSGVATALAPTANAVLVTSGTGNLVPQWSTSLPSGLTLTNPTISGTLNLNSNNITNGGTISATTFSGNLNGTASTVTTDANLTGPVTSVGNATSITPNAVTYGDIQAMSTNKLLGSGSGTAVQEITLGAGLSFSGSTLNASASELYAISSSANNLTSTTLAADPALQLNSLAAGTYEFSGVIAYDGAGSGGATSADLKLAMNFTGTGSFRWSADQAGTAVSPSSVTGNGTPITPFHVDPTTASNAQSIFISGILVVTASGTLQVEEALNSASGNTEILSNSFLRAVKVQ